MSHTTRDNKDFNELEWLILVKAALTVCKRNLSVFEVSDRDRPQNRDHIELHPGRQSSCNEHAQVAGAQQSLKCAGEFEHQSVDFISVFPVLRPGFQFLETSHFKENLERIYRNFKENWQNIAASQWISHWAGWERGIIRGKEVH